MARAIASSAPAKRRTGFFMARTLCHYHGRLTSIMATIRQARTAAGLGQGELARRAGISRQALGAIEAGLYQPSVAVALSLARELGTSVENLFGAADAPQVSANWTAHRGAASKPSPGTHVALARVNGKLIATPQPLSCLSLASAAGVIGALHGRRVTVE